MAAAFVSETTFTSGTTAVTSQTVAGPAAPANLAVLRIHRTSAISGGAITGVTDTAGNTWRLATRGGVSGSTKTRYECWYAEGYVPAATITMTGPSFPTAGSVLGFSGMATSGALEVASPDYSGVGTASTSISTPSITTATAGDVLVAGAGHGGTTTGGTVSSPWTRTAGTPALNNTSGTSEVAYRLGVAAGTYSATFTEAVAVIAGTFIVAFKAATGTAFTGTLNLAGSGALGLAGSPRTAGTLNLAGAGALTFGPPPQTASGNLSLAGAGTLALSGVGTWPHLSLAATPDPTFSPPRVRLDVVDTRTTPALSLTINRSNPDGTSSPVRTSDGGPLVLSGGVATIYDYEPAYGTPLTYSTDQANSPTATTELDGVDDVWLIHPGMPALSCPVKVTILPPGMRATTRGLHPVLGRSDPLPITSGPRQSKATTMGLRTFTADQERALDLMCDDDSVLLLNIPPSKQQWGWDSCYVSVGDLTPARTVTYGRDPQREWSLPLQVVARPGGGTQAAITWAEIANLYPTWQSIVDARVATWADLANPTT